MIIEEITLDAVSVLTEMMVEMWPDVDPQEEYKNNVLLLSKHSETVFLAKVGLQYIGFAHISIRRDYVEGTQSSPVGYLEGIYVRDGWRNQGTASALLSSGEAWLKNKGITEMGSDAEIDNSISQEWHTSRGFREVNRIVCFYKTIE